MTRLRWPFFGLPVFAALLAGAFLVESGNRAVGSIGGQGFDMLWAAAWLGFPVVGALILSRRVHHPIGWIMYAVGGCITLGLFANGVAIRHGFVEPVPVVGPVLTWLSFWVIVPAFGLPSLFLLLFPSGRASTVARRRAVWLVACTLGVLTFVNAVRPTQPLDGHGLTGQHMVNPLGSPVAGGFLGAAVGALAVVMAALTLLAILDALWRLFRGAPLERQQLKWVAVSVVPFPILMSIAGNVAGGRYNDQFVAVAFFVSLNGLTAAVLIAITRYRLYEIDRVVSRALAWTVVTAALVALYLLGVLAATQLLRPLGASSDLAVAASTLAVAAAFTPLRRRVQAIVDRRFNRARYDAQRTLDEFRARMRDHVDLDGVTAELDAVVSTSLSPSSRTLWLRSTGATR